MKLLTPRVIALLAIASVLSLLLPVLPDRFVSLVIFADASVVSLLLPERFVSTMARLVAAACILSLALVFWVTTLYAIDFRIRFPFLSFFYYSDLWVSVFLYGLPLFMAFALVALEKGRLTRTGQTPNPPLQPTAAR
jgi:hypothetical protein